MERLTIVRKPATSAESLHKYEIVETGEQFSSFISDMGSAFAEYIKDKELSQFVSSWLDECISQEPELHLDIPTFEESLPELKPELTPRQEQLEKILLKSIANAKSFKWALSDITREHCEGCEINNPSQLHHDCMTLSAQTVIVYYAMEALQRIDEDELMNSFVTLTYQELDKPLNALELLKYQCKDSRQEIISRRKDEFEDIAIEVYHNYINGYDNY